MQRPEGNGKAPGPSSRSTELTLVIPAYNEAERLEEGLRRLAEALPEAVGHRPVEVIVVDDGSTDGTGRRAQDLMLHFERGRVLPLAANSGKGAAVRAGVAAATGGRVAFLDADMSIDPSQLGALVSALDQADLAIGTRAAQGVVDYHNLARTTMGRGFNRLVNAVTGVGLPDTQCGFKAFTTPAARLLFHLAVIDRFAFDVEVLFRARRLGLRIAEVPVQWQHVADSRVRPVADPVTMLADVLRSRVGLPAPLPVQAIGLRPDSGRPGLADVPGLAGRHLPLVDDGAGGFLLLFPLVAPAEVAELTDRVMAAHPGWVTGRLGVTAAALERRAPVSVTEAVAGDVGPGWSDHRTTTPSPVGGPRTEAV